MRIERPALETLLLKGEEHPGQTELKSLLAVKKSFVEFLQRVESVVAVLEQLVSDPKVKHKTQKIDSLVLRFIEALA